MSKDNGGPAFPSKDAYENPRDGMSLRQWYAGQTLAGLLESADLKRTVSDQALADTCFAIADAMIAEGEK